MEIQNSHPAIYILYIHGKHEVALWSEPCEINQILKIKPQFHKVNSWSVEEYIKTAICVNYNDGLIDI